MIDPSAIGWVRRRVVVAAVLPLVLLAAPLLAGCGETARRATPPERGLHDPVIQTRLEALREVGRTRDARFVPDLIEMLDDEDPGIRLVAGATLRDVTGHDTGYRAHAGPEERLRQKEAWRQWWRERGASGGGGGAPPTRVPGAAPPTAPPATPATPGPTFDPATPSSPKPSGLPPPRIGAGR